MRERGRGNAEGGGEERHFDTKDAHMLGLYLENLTLFGKKCSLPIEGPIFFKNLPLMGPFLLKGIPLM